MRRRLFLLLAGMVLLGSCNDDSPELISPDPNATPEIVILSPAQNGADPTEILLTPSLTFSAADTDDEATALLVRWTFVSTASFGGDWGATKDTLQADPNGFIWTPWMGYAPAPGDSGMTVGDTLAVGSYVLAAQARDGANAVSELNDGNMRRVIAQGNSNAPPLVVIVSPPRSIDPLDVTNKPTVTVRITDDQPSSISYRMAYIPIGDYGHDWDATEDQVLTDPEGVSWWGFFAVPPGATAFTLPVFQPIDPRSYVLAVQALDANGAWSSLDDANLRRLRVVPEVNEDPTLVITAPVRNGLNPAIVPPISTFWLAADDVDSHRDDLSVRWALVSTRDYNESWTETIDAIIADPDAVTWSAWLPFVSGETTSAMPVTTPPTDFGPYVFAAQARDPYGGISVLDEIRSMRRVRVSTVDTGPLLVARNRFTGPVATAICNTPPVIVDVLSGVPIAFEWSGDAAAYGGILLGYRYGWDIRDLDDDSQWDIELTPFTNEWESSPPRSFDFGNHTFHVEVKDNSGFCTRAEFSLNVVIYQANRPLLLVDDYAADESPQAGWENPSGRGALPSDTEHDQFWLDMLSELDGFSTSDVIEVDRLSPLLLSTLAQYKTIIWSVYSEAAQPQNTTLLSRIIEYEPKRDPATQTVGYREGNPLAMFMAAGGNVLVTGRHPMANTINKTVSGPLQYPFMQLYDHEGQWRTPDVDDPPGDESFGYLDLCNETFEYAIANALRNDINECSVQGMRTVDNTKFRDTGMREAIPLDPIFPRLHMHDRTAGPGRFYDPAVRGFDAEVYNPRYFFNACQYAVGTRSCFEPIYGLHCLKTQEPTYNEPIAYWVVPENGGPRSAWFGFPLVHFEEIEARQALDQILYGEWGLARLP